MRRSIIGIRNLLDNRDEKVIKLQSIAHPMGYATYDTGRHFSLVFSIFLGRNFLFDQEIERVDWAEPEHEVDPDVMAKVKVLFIRNLTVNTTEDDISAAFEEASDGQIERVRKIRKLIHDRKLN